MSRRSVRRVRVKFEPRDLWLGVFVDTAKRRLYVCVVPCFPVVIDLPMRPVALWEWRQK